MSYEAQNEDGLIPVYESDLPEYGKELIGIVGLEAGARLIRELGGVPFPVPLTADGNRHGAWRFNRLVELCGEAGAQQIIALYGGTTMTVPRCAVARQRARWRRIAAFYDAGASLEETAVAFRITTRAISMGLKARVVEGHGYVIYI